MGQIDKIKDSEGKHIKEVTSRLKILQKATRAVYSSFDLKKIFNEVTDGAVHTMGYTTAVILTSNPEKSCFEIEALSTKKKLLPQINKILGFSLKSITIPVSYTHLTLPTN